LLISQPRHLADSVSLIHSPNLIRSIISDAVITCRFGDSSEDEELLIESLIESSFEAAMFLISRYVYVQYANFVTVEGDDDQFDVCSMRG
jgi:hypothetical protein